MAGERMVAFDLAGSRFPKTLGGAFVGFHFGHGKSPVFNSLVFIFLN